jgi:hypothetical protein
MNNMPVDVHQQYKSPTDDQIPNTYTPDSKEAEALKLVSSLYERGKSARKEFDQEWNKQENYYKGKQYLNKKRPSYRASPVANVIRPVVETVIPILTDTTPGFDAQPQEPSDYDFADMLSKAIRSWWKSAGMDHTLVEGLYDQSIKDAGILKCFWNTEKHEGLGDIDCYAPDPKNIYVPKGAIDFNKKCPWVMEIIPDYTVGELKRKFPDKAEFIKPTGKNENEQYKDQTYDGDFILVSPTDRKSPITDLIDVTGRVDDNTTVEIAETWLDDYSVEDFMLETEEGMKPLKKRIYPYGRLITWIPDHKVILQDKPSPYKDGKKPYVRLIDTIVPRQFWGTGEVKPLMEVQDMLNRNMAVIMDWMRTMTNPVWILDSDSGVEPDMLTNQVGLIIIKNPNSVVDRKEAPSLPAQIFSFHQLLRQLLDTQSGVHDVTQGRKPTGVTAAQAIQTMQEAAQTRIRLKERNMQVSLQQLGSLVISRILQFYREPRMVKLTGKEGWPEYFEFYIEENAEGDYEYIKRGYNYDKENKKYIPETSWKKSEKPSKGMFDVEVVSGTSLPFAKEKRGSLAMNLFDRQAIDQEELLKVQEWPRYEEVMRRMEQKAQAQAEAQPMPGGA